MSYPFVYLCQMLVFSALLIKIEMFFPDQITKLPWVFGVYLLEVSDFKQAPEFWADKWLFHFPFK